MTPPGEAGPHVQLKLGPYVLGALPFADSLAVEEHIERCATCRAECDELADVPDFLRLLSLADVETLAAGARDDAAAAGTPVRAASGPPTPPAGRRPATAASKATTAPPSRSRRRRAVPHRYRFLVYAAAAILVVGVFTGVWLRPDESVAVTLAGAQTDSVTGVRMAVTAVAQDGRAHVTADVAGLSPGREYTLYAVSTRGETREMTRWVTDDGRDSLTGELAFGTDALAFFTVVAADDSVVVTVRMMPPPPG